MLRQTFDIAVEALLGLDVDSKLSRDELYSTFNDVVNNIFCIPYRIPFCGYLKVSATFCSRLRTNPSARAWTFSTS